ncbi:YkgJ family cysteine cluster protein [Desulfobaculum bizertense]|uniref:YkgJ family cysteine cluster protein n=1 Tax=Desulfobaculum bizertense TaxID=376490 RepID=UPI001F38F321|nr:YkgJ family cysteine cluster protein [Desulfobaculum bizertense]UIJ36859.1 YkgJ family cysteine cluster protein [Desulfobaculum bizertense]
MSGKDLIFLTRSELLDAIRIDFEQYMPQLHLYTELYTGVTGGAARIDPDPEDFGIWVVPEGGLETFVPADEAGELVYAAIVEAELSAEELRGVAEKVFWGNVELGDGPDGEREGYWIETGMEKFVCRECGICCFTLDHHCSCTDADIERWREHGREDILAWVGDVEQDGELLKRRLWVNPKTGLPAETCPWIEERADGGFSCGIHYIKPDVCREYPGSIKHAALTGCVSYRELEREYRKKDLVYATEKDEGVNADESGGEEKLK